MPKSPPSPINSDILTITQAAAYLQVSRSTIYRLFRDGTLTYFIVRQRRRISRQALEAYLANAKGLEP